MRGKKADALFVAKMGVTALVVGMRCNCSILARADDTHLPVEAEPQRLHRWTAHSMPIVSMALSNLSGQRK